MTSSVHRVSCFALFLVAAFSRSEIATAQTPTPSAPPAAAAAPQPPAANPAGPSDSATAPVAGAATAPVPATVTSGPAPAGNPPPSAAAPSEPPRSEPSAVEQAPGGPNEAPPSPAVADAPPTTGKGPEVSAAKAADEDEPGGTDPSSLLFNAGKASIGFGARVIAGWEYEHSDLSPAQRSAGIRSDQFGWFLSQARFTVDGRWGKRLRMELDLDFSDNEPLRDAWLNYRFLRALQLRVGHFKRPFSRLELKGAGKLPIRDRGLGNGHLIEDLGYGGRSFGGELWGRLRDLGLDWFVAVSNPPPRYAGADVHARLTYAATPWLELGAAAAHKIMENNLTARPDFIAGNGAGLDLRVKAGSLDVLVDALLGENLGAEGLLEPDPRAVRSNSGSVSSYATYEIDLPANWELQPVVFGEWVDSNLEFSRSEAVRFVAGLNGLWHNDIFRVMPQVEFVRPLSANSETIWVARDTFYVMFSGQI